MSLGKPASDHACAIYTAPHRTAREIAEKERNAEKREKRRIGLRLPFFKNVAHGRYTSHRRKCLSGDEGAIPQLCVTATNVGVGIAETARPFGMRGAGAGDVDVVNASGRRLRGARTSGRLHPDVKLLLPERAASRQMAVATYISVLGRAHLLNLSLLPKDELMHSNSRSPS